MGNGCTFCTDHVEMGELRWNGHPSHLDVGLDSEGGGPIDWTAGHCTCNAWRAVRRSLGLDSKGAENVDTVGGWMTREASGCRTEWRGWPTFALDGVSLSLPLPVELPVELLRSAVLI
jgi:hypothetical protein